MQPAGDSAMLCRLTRGPVSTQQTADKNSHAPMMQRSETRKRESPHFPNRKKTYNKVKLQENEQPQRAKVKIYRRYKSTKIYRKYKAQIMQMQFKEQRY